jgi:hypothetical protein
MSNLRYLTLKQRRHGITAHPPPVLNHAKKMMNTWEALAKKILADSWGQYTLIQCNGREKRANIHKKNLPFVHDCAGQWLTEE